MLEVDPEKRFTVEQCLAHPWMTEKTPNVNDSTNGLVSGLAGLEVNRRGVTRQRTLLSSINTVQIANRIPGGANRPDVKVFAKSSQNPKAEAAAATPKQEPRPDDNRDPGEFMALGGKGDQELYGDDDASQYSVNDIADNPAPSGAKEEGKGKGKGKDRGKEKNS